MNESDNNGVKTADNRGEHPSDDGEARARSLVREMVAMVGTAFVLVLAATIAAQYVALVSSSLYLIVALVFLYLPNWWLDREGLDFERFGLVFQPLGRGLAWGLGATLVTLFPFAGGYWFWETQILDRQFVFQSDNLSKWSPQLRGRPDRWGEQPGVWVWVEQRQLHVGLRAEIRRPMTLQLEADRSAALATRGESAVYRETEEARPDERGSANARWRLEVPADARGEVVVERASPGMQSYPERLDVSIVSSDRLPIRAGPRETERSSGDATFARGWRWIGLWLLTQIFFIALPEEYFYRGYLQTRMADWLKARREARGASGRVRSFWGISEANGLASLVFGLGHLLIPVGGAILVTRASVFFPALVFGWLRDRTGSITAPIVYHAACNVMVLVAAPHFF